MLQPPTEYSFKCSVVIYTLMPESHTHTKWKNALREEFKKVHEVNGTSWDRAEVFSQAISKLLKGRNFDKDAKNAMLYSFYDPIVGLRGVEKKIECWHNIVTTVQDICIRSDGSLFRCPENMTTEKRLLNVDQSSTLLLLSILVLHESVYKSVVNFIYNLTGHDKHKDHWTTKQVKYLAKAGLDVQGASNKELRNSIAHMGFRVAYNGDVYVNSSTSLPPGFDAASGKPPPDVVKYERSQLIDAYNRSHMMLSDLFAATQHWFNHNYGPLRLFDDVFFETLEGNEIQKKAYEEMVNKPSVDYWDLVVKRARVELHHTTDEHAMAGLET